MAPTVDVFIDYQNAHFSGHELWCPLGEQKHHCLIEPLLLAERLVKVRAPGGVVQSVRVFRGRPSPRKDPVGAGRNDRQMYFWQLDPRVTVFRRELQYPTGWDDPVAPVPPREKGVDVGLAVDLVDRAIGGAFDVGIVFSHDTDIVPAIELAIKRGAHVEVGSWGGRNRLRQSGGKLFCHVLEESDFIAVRDTRHYPQVKPRPVLVDAELERPPAPPWVGTVPFPERVESWPGWLLGWRWLDQATGTWTGLVRYRREGLLYEHWIAGELLSSP